MPRAGLDADAVVRAAAEMADADGLDALTLSSVAAHLGVRPPSLYAHVAGLADLRARISTLAAGELADVLAPAVAGRAAGDALRAAGHAYRGWALAHPGRHAALQFVRPSDPEPADRAVALLVSVMHGYALEDDAAVHAVRAVRAAISGFVALEAGGGFGMPLDPTASFEWMLDAFDRGLTQTAAGGVNRRS